MRKLLFILALFPLLTFAQDKVSIVKLKSGVELKGVIKSIDPTDAVVIDIAGIETRVMMDNILVIEESDKIIPKVSESESPSNKTIELQEIRVEDPLKDFKGFLLAKGNNVYVYHGNSDGDSDAKYDKEAARIIADLLRADGFWNVVDKMNQAHFTINYCVDTRRSDKAVLTISSWRSGKSNLLGIKDSNESVEDNVSIAKKFYRSKIKPLQKKIENDNISKSMKADYTVN